MSFAENLKFIRKKHNITQEQLAEHAELSVVSEGEKVYEDETYVVLHYDSVEEIIQ